MDNKYLVSINDRHSIITAISDFVMFPESMDKCFAKYNKPILSFLALVKESDSSDELLGKVRNVKDKISRMTYLKIFRRCVCPILDTEMTKKIKKVSTQDIIKNYGDKFKDINELKEQFNLLAFCDHYDSFVAAKRDKNIYALCALLGEYDSRGQLGYELTSRFFSWFNNEYSSEFSIIGPEGAGRDIELNSIIKDFNHTYPCDFIIRNMTDDRVVAVGFARYDSTRGGSQADDRTGGNSDKVWKAKEYFDTSGEKFKIIFLSDGPGLAHKDIWNEACKIDGRLDGNVRVTTLKTLKERVTREWLLS